MDDYLNMIWPEGISKLRNLPTITFNVKPAITRSENLTPSKPIEGIRAICR